MAIQGLSTFLHAPLADEVTATYSGLPTKTGGAIEVTPNITYSNTPIHSDDRLKHLDVSFVSGTLDLTVDYGNKEILSPIMGRKVITESFTPDGGGTVSVKRHVSNSNDKPVPQGFGYITSVYDVDNDKNMYTVVFFYKVQFSPSLQTIRTKEGTKTYTFARLSGTIFELPNHDWMEEVDFEDLDVAVEFLNSLFKIAANEARLRSLSVVSSGELIPLSPAFDKDIYLYDIGEVFARLSATVTAVAINSDAVVTTSVEGPWVFPIETDTFDVYVITVTNSGQTREYKIIAHKS